MQWFWPFTRSQSSDKAQTTGAEQSNNNSAAPTTTQAHQHFSRNLSQSAQPTPVSAPAQPVPAQQSTEAAAPTSEYTTEYNWHGHSWPMTTQYAAQPDEQSADSIPRGSTVITDYNLEQNTLSTVIEPPPTSWLVHWNNHTDPTKLSCKHAFDTLMYCFTPANQVRTIYRTGRTDSCINQFYDIHRCLQIKAEAIKSVDAAQMMLYESYADRIKQIEEIQRNHIWKYRQQVPEQFRWHDVAADETDTEQQKTQK